jgi:transcription antitermination factor NusG
MFKLSKADREHYERMRGCYLAESSWYGLLIHSGRERKAQERVMRDFGQHGVEEILLPELADGPVGKTGPSLLFGGHLFLRCRMIDEIYIKVAAYTEVMKILGRAYRIPDIICNQEMEIFKSVLATYPLPKLATRMHLGAAAQVTDGLLHGLQGRIVEVTAKHVKIESCFSFLGNDSAIVVSVPREQIQYLERDPAQQKINGS